MNPWLDHVKTFRVQHPKLSYKEVLIEAKKTYKAPKGRPSKK